MCTPAIYVLLPLLISAQAPPTQAPSDGKDPAAVAPAKDAPLTPAPADAKDTATTAGEGDKKGEPPKKDSSTKNPTTDPNNPATGNNANTPPDGTKIQNQPGSLADKLTPWLAAAIGAFGAFAYLVAVWAGFVARDDQVRDKLLRYFIADGCFKWKCISGLLVFYILGGAGVALVFQMPESKLVPVQAFILGCTWPAIVANYLSNRQTGVGVPPEKLEPVAEAGTELKEMEQMLNGFATVVTPTPQEEQKKNEINNIRF